MRNVSFPTYSIQGADWDGTRVAFATSRCLYAGVVPDGGPGSLDGHHVFGRFNPAVGMTYDASSHLNLYAGYSEGSRAATSIELGCADPEQPCKLPNAMAGDPPLDQIVTRTFEAGVRGERGRVNWHGGGRSGPTRARDGSRMRRHA